MLERKKIKKILRVGRVHDSGLSSFVERPVPTEKEVEVFERVVNREVREQEIDSNLSEIYSDHDGQRVNVQKMKVRRRAPFILRLFRRLLLLTFIFFALAFAYLHWFGGVSDVSALNVQINAPENILAGEEFVYRLDYHNPTKYPLSKLRLELQYPENFIFHSADPAPNSGNYGWDLPDMAPGEKRSLIISGQIISQPDTVAIIFSNLSYLPGNFSSQFKKETSASSWITGPGFRADLRHANTAFLGNDNEMTLILSEINENKIGDFYISFSLPPEASAEVIVPTPVAGEENSSGVRIIKSGGTSWQLSGLTADSGRQEINLVYRIRERSQNPEIRVRLEKKSEDGQAYIFWERVVRPELVDSDLNLSLSLNGSKNDSALNFGQNLNYSLTYANHGLNTFQNVVIMASLAGDFLDWRSLNDGHRGDVKNGSIVWTKKEIPALAEIKPGDSGEIKFSFNIKSWQDTDLGSNLEISAFAQYGMNNLPARAGANKSNVVVGRLNSDLKLQEQIRYFNNDNFPVGSGPLPPQVGEKTQFKVYWTLNNNIHELSETRVTLALPAYVSWDGDYRTNVGNLYYDDLSRQVVWEIGRLPLSVYRVDAEFSIGLVPTVGDQGKILVLSPGAVASAMDTETKAVINYKSSPKTTKLEDDDIAGLNNSGVVR